MNDLTTDIKTIQEETILNLKNSKAQNTLRAYKSDFHDFGLFLLKMDLNHCQLNQKHFPYI